MAEPPAPVPQADDDPFELGDTGLNLTSPTTPEPAKKPVPPKGPDGKFISPAAVQPEPVEPPQSKHPAGLVRQAVDFGMDESVIEEMSTPALYRTVNLFYAREREISQSFAKQATLEAARVPTPAPQPAEPEPVDPLDALVEEGFDPRIINALKEAKKAPADKIKALETELANERQARVQGEISDKMAIVDAAFRKLNNPLLGDGTGIELAADPAKKAEFQRRIAVLTTAGITDMRQVNRATIMKLIRESAETLFGGVASKPSEEPNPYAAGLAARQQSGKPAVSPEEWNNGGVARPSRRNGSPELKGEALAIKNLTDKFREQDSQRTDEAELEGIPD